MNSAIIVAAGRSERMGGASDTDKAFLSLGSRPVLAYAIMAFEACTEVDEIVLVVRREKQVAAKGMARMFGCSKLRQVVCGGRLRQESVAAGLRAVNREARIVIVHDGARPLVTPELIVATLKSAKRYGTGIAARKSADTVKFAERGLTVDRTLDRDHVWLAQTPQAFKLPLLQAAYDDLEKNSVVVTDDASAVERLGETVRLVESSDINIKITTPDDLRIAATLLRV